MGAGEHSRFRWDKRCRSPSDSVQVVRPRKTGRTWEVSVTTFAAISDGQLQSLLSLASGQVSETDEGRPTHALIAVPHEPAWFPPPDHPRFTVEKRVESVACRLFARSLALTS